MVEKLPQSDPSGTILIVDDEERNRALLRAYLGGTYELREAADGPAALAVLEREAIDLVLLDVMMPQISGYEVCRTIKSKPRDGFLPVLLLTALHDQEARNDGLSAGADDFLAKPVDRRELLLRVRAFLRIRAQEAVIRRQVQRLAQLQAFKDDLFTLIVHDLRNPLSGVMGYLEIIDAELADARLRDPVAKARESALRLRETLDQILQVRLIEEGELTPRREPTAIAHLLADAVRPVEGAACSRSISIEVAVAPGAPASFPLDRSLVRRAIENLLGNAVKYAAKGTAVTLSAAAEPDGGLAFEVADRGPGVPDALRDVIFQKYGSVEARRGEMRRGFGLGLYLVKLVAAAHGGDATVRDREGGGAVFRLVLGPAAASR